MKKKKKKRKKGKAGNDRGKICANSPVTPSKFSFYSTKRGEEKRTETHTCPISSSFRFPSIRKKKRKKKKKKEEGRGGERRGKRGHAGVPLDVAICAPPFQQRKREKREEGKKKGKEKEEKKVSASRRVRPSAGIRNFFHPPRKKRGEKGGK